MDHIQSKKKKRLQRKKRIRKKVSGTDQRPRMTVFRSLKHCYVQLVDDISCRTLLGLSTLSKEFRGKHAATGDVESARILGALVAEKALGMNIHTVVFDRNGYLYHGRVKALAEGAREKGLKF